MTTNYCECVNCKQRRPCFLFEIAAQEEGDDEFTDTLGRIVVCTECVKDPIVQRTIVTVLVEDAAPP